jgi:hypothetical protein
MKAVGIYAFNPRAITTEDTEVRREKHLSELTMGAWRRRFSGGSSRFSAWSL